MGHFAIVDQESRKQTFDRGLAQVRANLGTGLSSISAIKGQLADLLADALAIRPGDLIVPWLIGAAQGAPVFDRLCIASDRARYLRSSPMPVLIPLQSSQRCYPGITEAMALDLWQNRLLWNAIGKKSLGRGRGITHQTPFEDAELIRRINDSGPGEDAIIDGEIPSDSVPLTINTMHGSSEEDERLLNASPSNRLGASTLKLLNWRDGSRFVLEKALEAWLMENYDLPAGASLRNVLLDPDEQVIWAANYLPFGVAGASIDVVMITKLRKQKRLRVLELKRGTLSASDSAVAATQVNAYANFLQRFLERWGMSSSYDVVPSIISALGKHDVRAKGLSHLHYSIGDSGDVNFT